MNFQCPTLLFEPVIKYIDNIKFDKIQEYNESSSKIINREMYIKKRFKCRVNKDPFKCVRLEWTPSNLEKL